MISLVGKAVTGKMIWVVGGVLAALLMAIAGMGWALDRATEKTAQAREKAAIAEQRAAQLTVDLEHQVRETAAADRRYTLLDQRFSELQAQKQKIRTVVKKERVYIRESADNDETVKAYLADPIPDAINCLLDESCG